MYWIDKSDSSGATYDKNSVLQYWDSESGYTLFDQFENDIVLSTYDFLYLDCGTGSPQGGNSWCDPYKTWAKIYTFNP